MKVEYCALWLVCLVPAAFCQTLATLQGTIADTSGTPLHLVTVKIASSQATTDATGKYSVAVSPGTYQLDASLAGYKTERATVVVDRSRNFGMVLTPDITGPDPVITSVGDAASNRPQYLPHSELSVGGLFTAYLNAPEVRRAVAESLPWPTSLGGMSAALENDQNVSFPIRLYFVSPTQFSGVIPSNTTPGKWYLKVSSNGRTSKKFPMTVITARPTLFSLRGTGSGPGVFTDPLYRVITPQDPARPNGNYVAWLTNVGSSPKDGDTAVEDKLGIWPEHRVLLGGEELPRENIQFLGVAGQNYGQMNFKVPPKVKEGCNVSMQIGVRTSADGGFHWSNVVTLPIAGQGPCQDVLGFQSADVNRLFSGESLDFAALTISEASYFSRTGRRDFLLGHLRANSFNQNTFTAAPALDTCTYSLFPQGFTDPFAAPALPFTGESRVNLPFTTLIFAPNSNSGPYSLTYAPPNSYQNGNFTLNYTQNFAVGGVPFQATSQGVYTRAAGTVSTPLIAQLRYLSIVSQLQQLLLPAIAQIRTQLQQNRLAADITVQVQDDTRGRHVNRCLVSPEAATVEQMQRILTINPLVPLTGNRTDFSVRFVPQDILRFPHTGAIDQTNVVFDRIFIFQDINLSQ